MKTITSSLKLQFHHIIKIHPYNTLNIIGQEFVLCDNPGLVFEDEIGDIQFNKVTGKLYLVDDTYFISLRDGRTFSYTNEQ